MEPTATAVATDPAAVNRAGEEASAVVLEDAEAAERCGMISLSMAPSRSVKSVPSPFAPRWREHCWRCASNAKLSAPAYCTWYSRETKEMSRS